MNPAFDGTQWLCEHVSNFMVLVSVEVQHEGLFEYGWKLMNCFVDVFHPHCRLCSIGNSRLVMVEEEFVWTVVENGILLGLSAVVVDEEYGVY